ncbi:hypothetical protein [Nocardia aurantiaca]|uniref:hypothetical protein n=1 Tax=Nocardia aurantiaca TaxID=2675850 RepID=UPI0018AC055A|nr:hypothetical protein [Nocardia aurantiaca]
MTWIETASGTARGAAIVTGDPGSGKSAVLSRLIVPTDPEYRAMIPPRVLDDAAVGTVAAVGQVDAAVHAAGKSTAHITKLIGDALGAEHVSDTEDLIDLLDRRGEPAVVVIDALDEAAQPRELVRELLIPLIRNNIRPGIRLVLGTRRELLPFLRASNLRIDLDNAEYFSSDEVSAYITSYLLGESDPTADTPYRGRIELAKAIGHEAADRAGNSFLIAQLVALDLIQRDDVIDPYSVGAFPSTVADAMERYLASAGQSMHRNGILAAAPEACAQWVRDLLRPLAFAEGEGLNDDDLWAELATQLGVGRYEAVDVRKLRDNTPALALLRSVEFTQRPSWSLFHEALAEYLRDDAARLHGSTVAAQSGILDVLSNRLILNGSGHLEWRACDAYSRANLARHAAKAQRLDELVVDAGFLLMTDPEHTIPLLQDLRDPKALAAAHVYELSSHGMRDADESRRATVLGVTAKLYGVDFLAEELAATSEMEWEVKWTQWKPPGRHRCLPDHEAGTTAIAVSELGEFPVAIIGCADGSVSIWDLHSSTMIGDPWAGHVGPVTAIACAELNECPVVITGSSDGTVRVRDLLTGMAIGAPSTPRSGPVNTIACAEIDGNTVVIAGSADGTVLIRDLLSGTPLAEPFTDHTGSVNAVASATIDNRCVVFSAGADRTLRCWDAKTCVPLSDAGEGHSGTINCLAVVTDPDGIAVVSGATDGTLRYWTWTADTLVSKSLRGHQGWVNGVAVGRLNNTPIAVSASNDRTVRMWNLLTRKEIGLARTGHRTKITDVALADVHGRPTAITTSNDRTVRLWDLTAEEPRRSVEGLAHSGGINAIAVGDSGHKRIAITVSNDRTLQVWDTDLGQTFGPNMASDSGLQAVTVAQSRFGPIAVTGNRNGTIEVWNLAGRDLLTTIRTAHKGKVNGLAVVDLGVETIISVGDDRAIRLWRLDDGTSRGAVDRAHKGAINALAISRHAGAAVAITASNDRTVRTWDLATMRPHGPAMCGHHDWIRAVSALSVDGSVTVVSGSNDRTIRIWDATEGALRQPPLEGHTGAITSMAIGTVADRPVLVTAATDGTLRVWDDLARDIRTSMPIVIGSVVQSIAITSTGEILLAGPAGCACLRPIRN